MVDTHLLKTSLELVYGPLTQIKTDLDTDTFLF